MAHHIAQCVLAFVPGVSLGSKSLGALLVLLGIASFLTGASYGKPNDRKSRRQAQREKLVGKSSMKELRLTPGICCVVFGVVVLLFF